VKGGKSAMDRFGLAKKSRYHHHAAALRGFTTSQSSPKTPDESCNIMECELDGECAYDIKNAMTIHV
jgi:hypothetical protein